MTNSSQYLAYYLTLKLYENNWIVSETELAIIKSEKQENLIKKLICDF